MTYEARRRIETKLEIEDNREGNFVKKTYSEKKNVGLKVKHNLKLVKKVEKRMLENVQKRKYLETRMITMDPATCDNKII